MRARAAGQAGAEKRLHRRASSGAAEFAEHGVAPVRMHGVHIMQDRRSMLQQLTAAPTCAAARLVRLLDRLVPPETVAVGRRLLNKTEQAIHGDC